MELISTFVLDLQTFQIFTQSPVIETLKLFMCHIDYIIVSLRMPIFVVIFFGSNASELFLQLH